MADQLSPVQPGAPTQFGAGKPTKATIDQVNIAMRAMPWYQNLIKSFGQDPNNVHLNDQQKQQVLRGAQASGIQVNEGDMEVDPAGNFNPKGHKLRNTLIVAGLAGATIATMGAAGAFSAAAGMAGGAAGAGAAGTGGAGAAGLGFGTVGLGAGGLGGASAAAGGGLVGGLGATGAALGGTAAATGAGLAGTTGALLPSTTIGSFGASALPAGLAPSAAGTAALSGARATGTGGSVMSRLLNPSNIANLASTAQGFGNQEASNRKLEGEFSQNYDKNMLAAQADRRLNESDAMKKLATTSYITGGGSKFKPPSLTLNNKSYAPMDLGYGPVPVTDVEKQGAQALQDQLVSRLGPRGSYTPQPLSSYATPGKAEKAGNWLQTGLGVGGTIANIMGYGK